jgi:hypothetical protein
LTKKLALITGTLGPLAVVLLTILGGVNFPNYSHASQFISELGATGAPNGRIISLAGFLPAGVLIIAFAFFAWRSLPPSGATTFGMIGLALFALGYLVAAFFPCEADCRPTDPTLSQRSTTSSVWPATWPHRGVCLFWAGKRAGGPGHSICRFLVSSAAVSRSWAFCSCRQISVTLALPKEFWRAASWRG